MCVHPLRCGDEKIAAPATRKFQGQGTTFIWDSAGASSAGNFSDGVQHLIVLYMRKASPGNHELVTVRGFGPSLQGHPHWLQPLPANHELVLAKTSFGRARDSLIRGRDSAMMGAQLRANTCSSAGRLGNARSRPPAASDTKVGSISEILSTWTTTTTKVDCRIQRHRRTPAMDWHAPPQLYGQCNLPPMIQAPPWLDAVTEIEDLVKSACPNPENDDRTEFLLETLYQQILAPLPPPYQEAYEPGGAGSSTSDLPQWKERFNGILADLSDEDLNRREIAAYEYVKWQSAAGLAGPETAKLRRSLTIANYYIAEAQKRRCTHQPHADSSSTTPEGTPPTGRPHSLPQQSSRLFVNGDAAVR